MHELTFTCSSWHQGQYSGGTYTDNSSFIASDAVEIPFGIQSISCSGEGNQTVWVKEYHAATTEHDAYFDDPYLSTATGIAVCLLDKDRNLIVRRNLSRGSTVDVSSYPTAKYAIIEIEAASTSVIYLWSIRPDEASCVSTTNRCICRPFEFGITYLQWEMYSDGFPRYEEADLFPSEFIPPLPDSYWRIVNDVPTNMLMPQTVTPFIDPIPKAHWRIDSAYNNGFPFNELIPDIPYNPLPPPPAPTIDPVEFYDEYNAEYLSALYQKHRRYKVRLELLGYYENVVGEIARDLSRGASGSITINNEQITRRSCSLSLINVDKKYLPSPDSPIWFNRKFKLWIGIVTGKHTYWWSYGVFFTTKATCDGATLNIQGVDKGGALDGTIKTGMLDAENIIERGTTLTNVIKDTLMWNEFSSPYLNHNTGSSSYPVDPIKPIIDTKFDSITTQAEITINANDYISTLFSSIADGYGADAYYNTNGHFVFQTMADSSRIDGYRFMSRQWNFADTDEMYSNASIEYNLDGYNVVTVYTNESTLENVSYTAANNNPASPLRLDSAGIRRMSDIEIPYVNVSQDEMEGRCKAYADYLLMKEAMKGMSITFNCPILPHLDVNRTIGITDKWLGLEDATFVVNSITMPLGAESMTINATQFDWLPDDLNIEG